MSRDVSTRSAVLLTTEDLRPLFTSRKLSVCYAGYLLAERRHLIRECFPEGRIVVKRIWKDQPDEVDSGIAEARLAAVRQGEDLFLWLKAVTFACQGGEVGRYSNTYIANEEILLDFWNSYLRAWSHCSKQLLPPIEQIVTFGSELNSGMPSWVCGIPHLSFSTDSVFEQRLSLQGQALSNALARELSVETWSVVNE